MNNKPSRVVPFVFGLILGILGTIFLPGYVKPYIPDWAAGKKIVVNGIVTAKQKKQNALLLTVSTSEGAILATFTRKIDEVGLLVNEKDEIEFVLPKYAPFIENPRIIRIVKEEQPAPEPPPAEKGAKGVNPRQPEKPQPAAPARGGAKEEKSSEQK